ncbi:hypothetical protein SDC9_77650 [bioreactor metagenome]|uniref:Uncharacterized protein n=1 Tax=bioreactor metagenome TaxID=1076179 RepID=A0A644YS16_9ZZZZ
MPEVLSQNQIDALMASVLDGSNVEDSSLEDNGKKYRNYDFYSPRSILKISLT